MKNSLSAGRHYEQRLQVFLGQLSAVKGKSAEDLHQIMDTVPFKDLETALMMATMEVEALQTC